MNALDVGFCFTIRASGKSLTLRQGEHIRIYPTGRNKGFGHDLTKRQIDLIRIATAVHVADGWVRRKSAMNGLRNPILEVEVLDLPFWSRSDTLAHLKTCVDFLSGDDDWSFRFTHSNKFSHCRRNCLFDGLGGDAVVSLYSGGLDSAAGLAARLHAEPGRTFIPVTVRHQMQKSQLIRGHFDQLVERGIAKRGNILPFQAGAFIRNDQIKKEFSTHFREITHRCRPFLFMSVAGLVAKTFATSQVEVYESGVGSINIPLVAGPADYRTTRSTHPYFLRLISALVSHVNDSPTDYVLPFAGETKAEMASKLQKLGLEELARKSISCILHPLRRKGWQQCGHCPACVFRSQALMTAGISESDEAYAVDLFAAPTSAKAISAKQLRSIKAFHQQIARLDDLDSSRAPACFKRYLKTTHAIDSDDQLAPHIEVYRRYRQEWLNLIAYARRHGLPWIVPARSRQSAEGATP